MRRVAAALGLVVATAFLTAKPLAACGPEGLVSGFVVEILGERPERGGLTLIDDTLESIELGVLRRDGMIYWVDLRQHEFFPKDYFAMTLDEVPGYELRREGAPQVQPFQDRSDERCVLYFTFHGTKLKVRRSEAWPLRIETDPFGHAFGFRKLGTAEWTLCRERDPVCDQEHPIPVSLTQKDAVDLRFYETREADGKDVFLFLRKALTRRQALKAKEIDRRGIIEKIISQRVECLSESSGDEPWIRTSPIEACPDDAYTELVGQSYPSTQRDRFSSEYGELVAGATKVSLTRDEGLIKAIDDYLELNAVVFEEGEP